MHYELKKESKVVSLKTRLALIIAGLVLLAIFLGIIIWSGVILGQLPSTYHKDSSDYQKALTFGIVNGIFDFCFLVLFANISIYAYSTKIFKTISKFNDEQKIKKQNSKQELNETKNNSLVESLFDLVSEEIQEKHGEVQDVRSKL